MGDRWAVARRSKSAFASRAVCCNLQGSLLLCHLIVVVVVVVAGWSLLRCCCCQWVCLAGKRWWWNCSEFLDTVVPYLIKLKFN